MVWFFVFSHLEKKRDEKCPESILLTITDAKEKKNKLMGNKKFLESNIFVFKLCQNGNLEAKLNLFHSKLGTPWSYTVLVRVENKEGHTVKVQKFSKCKEPQCHKFVQYFSFQQTKFTVASRHEVNEVWVRCEVDEAVPVGLIFASMKMESKLQGNSFHKRIGKGVYSLSLDFSELRPSMTRWRLSIWSSHDLKIDKH